MMWNYAYFDPSMWVGMVVQGALWLLLAAVAVWALVRWLNRPPRSATPPPNPPEELSALDTLKQRYARGELDTATFEPLRAHLDPSERVLSQSPELITSGR
jgi:putative membrane protein